MNDFLRISARELVEFSIHGEDIVPGGGIKDMLEGMRGHKARQGMLGEGWQAEAPVSLKTEAEGIDFLITGRMDAYFDAPVPIIEELKLLSGAYAPPEKPYPAHRAQAVVYGHLVCLEKGKEAVRIRVVYVSVAGAARALFEEELTAAQLMQEFEALLAAFAVWESAQRRHRARRDESIDALPFPYPGYRRGQREMAVQVFTAVRQKKRLFASMPTGTGKSAAVLFPALKALGQGLTSQIFYLTARTTARQGALDALKRMREKGLHARALTLIAKEKQCPALTRCHPDFCPRAKGHFLRLPTALEEIMELTDWNAQAVRDVADRHELCPFEFALSLTEIADVVVCDYNYAFDPAAHLQRIFDHRTDLTLLVDESHNLAGRTREMLSGAADGAYLRTYRTMLGKAAGRKGRLYKALKGVLDVLREIPFTEDAEEKEIASLPEELPSAMEALLHAVEDAFGQSLPGEAGGKALSEVYQMAASFCAAIDRGLSNYALLCRKHGRERSLKLLCLSVAEHLQETTKKLSGTVYFSATLSPLSAMRALLGGDGEDALFALPSPFPPENLLVKRQRISTRYGLRRETAHQVAAAILQVFSAKPGKYIAFFPSYAYLKLVLEALLTADPALPLLIQSGGMEEADRVAFIDQFTLDSQPLLGLAVLGGIFAEGIDLPGERLLGVMVVGVGLPMVCPEQEALRRHYEETLGDGFAYAYRYPGMHKVLQAVGRVIRSETDRGVALLIDERYFQHDYVSLCPPHWHFTGETAEGFWAQGLRP